MNHWILLLFASLLFGVKAEEVRISDGVTYHLVFAKPENIRILWKSRNGQQMRTIPEVADDLRSRGEKPSTVMNAGIFEPGGIPCGLLIQSGKVLNPVNRGPGKGNFYLKPSGIFMIGTTTAAIVRTDEYPAAGFEVRYATQSGPLLLRRGMMHPAISATSSSRLHRNGVGITRDGKVILAMTDFHSSKFPNLYEFAMLFQKLGCDDALFLDGDLSQMRSGADLGKESNLFGAMIAVVNQ
jgi:uncharacterized protein YigE (DUF2233 family)